ncbi:MAG: diguanylate cyclase/phosphodiesterase [Proteobacteria bacterium]|nr:diguanylate cyclase/phosphodiesterase [Pseudomonadota bacterium]
MNVQTIARQSVRQALHRGLEQNGFVLHYQPKVDIGTGAIVSAIIAMGKSLKLRVVAEGIETRQQLSFLHAQQCAEGQGYYFSPPVAAADFAALLQRWPRQERR